jgi:hypothetical protein
MDVDGADVTRDEAPKRGRQPRGLRRRLATVTMGRAEAISATAKQLRDMLHEYLDWVEGRGDDDGERPEIPTTDTLPF